MENHLNIPEDYLARILDSIISAIPTESVYVFGSYARGEETPESDLDIYIVTSDMESIRYDLMGKVGYALLWMDQPKDVLVGTSARFDERKGSLSDIEHVVAREGVKVYDRAA